MSMADLIQSAKRFARPLKPYLQRWGTVSYGQYGEDLMVLKTMWPSRRGFYVDVGAYDPIEGSNTYKLYKMGWRGITIEPNPGASWKFNLLRGRDRHLTVGVAPQPTTLQYHKFRIGMLNTMDGERAKSLADSGYETAGVLEVRCDRLDTLLDENAPGKHIDLLSVDCEGDDLGILATLDFVRWRPTVVLMEDLEGYYSMGQATEASTAMKFMRERGYAPIARLVHSVAFVALDWRALNRRTGAYREKAIHPGLLPEGAPPVRAAQV